MIRIEFDRSERISSEFAIQAEKAAVCHLRLSDLTAEISRLSCTEDVVSRLKILTEQLEIIQNDLKEMGSSLREVCQAVRWTENDITDVYEQEKIVFLKPVTGQIKVELNPRLAEIARIEL